MRNFSPYSFLFLLTGLPLILGFAPASTPQNGEDVQAFFQQVASSIRNGNAQALSKHFNSNVEVTIDEQDQDYTANQATFVLQEFFRNNPNRSFEIRHNGFSGDTHYAIGVYQSSRGNFDTNIFVKKRGDRYLIDQIRFERDN